MSKRLRFDTEDRDRILLFVENDADELLVPLNDNQKRRLERWRFADELLRQNGEYVLRENVVLRIMDKFSVSRDTAYKDVVNAEYVFYSSSPMNKLFFIQRKIDALNKRIYDIEKSMYDENGIYCFDQDKHDVINKIEATIQKYIKDLPELIEQRSPKNIVYKIVQNNLTVNNVITPQEADDKYQAVLKRLQDNEDY